MRIKLYENRDFMRRTQIKLMQEEVHIWCIRWKEVIPVFEYYQLMLDQKEKGNLADSRCIRNFIGGWCISADRFKTTASKKK